MCSQCSVPLSDSGCNSHLFVDNPTIVNIRIYEYMLNSYVKFGGARRRRFFAICGKSEGADNRPPPAVRGLQVDRCSMNCYTTRKKKKMCIDLKILFCLWREKLFRKFRS